VIHDFEGRVGADPCADDEPESDDEDADEGEAEDEEDSPAIGKPHDDRADKIGSRSCVYVYRSYHTYMKTKLTLSIERDLIPRAKRHARARGMSLSALVEAALMEATGPPRPSFTETWRGAFTLSSDAQDERYRALVDKYG
jgi:post-segregation antitoxin (ccd killing protein)